MESQVDLTKIVREVEREDKKEAEKEANLAKFDDDDDEEVISNFKFYSANENVFWDADKPIIKAP